MTTASAIYRGSVVHERRRPKRHRLRYRVFSLLLDLDSLSELDRGSRLFGYNRRAPLAFHDADHGPTTGAPLRPWVEARLTEAGLAPDGGPIRLLCYPRVFGYVFNPLSVFFCYRKDGGLAAILYEVCNTFRERHTYVIPVGGDADGNGKAVIRQRCAKALYVSPFIGMEAQYHFRILAPDDGVSVVIRQEDDDGLLLAASFRGEREDWSDRALLRCLAGFPLLTLKIIAAIHWEALRMWLKGFRVFPHDPAGTPVGSSVQHLKIPNS
jgi:hypothetical protein